MGDYLENLINQWLFANTAIAARGTANLSIALYTVTPSDTAASGTEVTGGSYARVAVTNSSGWTIPGTPNTAVVNAADIVFPTATANWGTIVAACLVDSGGNQLMWGPLTVSKTVNSGDSFKIAAGQATFLVDN